MIGRKWMWTGVVAAAAVALALFASSGKSGEKKLAEVQPLPRIEKTTIAGPGRVEPDSEEVKLGSELAGKLRAVLVNDEYRAAVANSEALVQQKDAAWRKSRNGSRQMERREAEASVREAETVESNAQSEMARRQKLWQAGVVSREEVEHYEREYGVARAKLEAARQHFRAVDDETREEDRSAARERGAGRSGSGQGATGGESRHLREDVSARAV